MDHRRRDRPVTDQPKGAIPNDGKTPHNPRWTLNGPGRFEINQAEQPERIDLGEIPINDRILPIANNPRQFPRVFARPVAVEDIPPACPHCRLVGGGHTPMCITQLAQQITTYTSVTDGGLAEAGYQPIGYIVGDGPTTRED